MKQYLKEQKEAVKDEPMALVLVVLASVGVYALAETIPLILPTTTTDGILLGVLLGVIVGAGAYEVFGDDE